MIQPERDLGMEDPIVRKTILIADDDDDFRTLLSIRCNSISGFDCAVASAGDALTALSCVDIALPDLVILDVDMPGSGLATCEMMASDENLAHIPVIILTGRKDDGTVQRCSLLAAHYVHKSPNSWAEIEAIIREKFSLAVPARNREARLLSGF